jgi:maltose-binding protein MalE
VPIALEPATVALTGDTTGTPSAGATSPLTHTLDALTLDALTLDASAADAVSARLATALAAEGRLDLLLVPHRWIPTLVANEELRELSTLIDAETLQRYRPVAVEAMRYQGGLYGLPLTVNLDVLYYNRTLVEEPARTLAELQQQAAAGTPIALDYTFRHAFWGIPAFGGQLIDAQGQLALGQGSFVNWLSWLQQARDTANLLLLPDRSVLLTRFLNRNSAYYVAGPAALPQLQAALGADTVGVARLPSGPDGDAGSLLTATGLLFSDRLSASQLELAFTVANYLTSIQSQRTFFAMADQIPTNIGFDVPPEAPLAAVAEQVQAGVLLVNLPVIDLLLRQGDSVYQAVLEEGVAPEVAVEELLRAVAEAPVE